MSATDRSVLRPQPGEGTQARERAAAPHRDVNPRVSAIVVNFHSAALARRAVSSLPAPSAQPEVEIFVVDNSAAESERRALDDLSGLGVELILNDRNVGFGAACNQAYARARGEYLLLLNPDAYLLPGALETLIGDLDAAADVAAVSPVTWLDDDRVLMTPPSSMPGPWDEVSRALLAPWPTLRVFNGRRWRRRALAVLAGRGPVQQECLSGAHVLLRRSAVERAGGLFDERFFLYFEDSDLFRRLRGAGFRLLLDARAQGVHHFDQCVAERPGDKARLGAEAYARYLDKYDRRGRVRRFAGLLRALLPASRPVRHRELGVVSRPPQIEVPESLRPGWALEVAAHEAFVPAAVMFGSGGSASLPEAAWSVLNPRRYYMRLGPRAGMRAGPSVTFEKEPA